MARFHKDGVPDLSVEEIEREIDRMTEQGELTERWMSSRTKRKMDQMSERDELVRRAFIVGYRMGADKQFIAPLAGLLIALMLIQVLALLTGQGWVLIDGWPD